METGKRRRSAGRGSLSIMAGLAGGVLWMALQYLWYLSHGPTGVDRMRLVWDLLGSDFERLLIIPIALVWVAFLSRGRAWTAVPGSWGRIGYYTLLASYSLSLVSSLGTALFPFRHPIATAAFFLWIAIFPLLLVGWLILGIAWLRRPQQAGLRRLVPLLMGLGLLGTLLWALLDLAPDAGYPPSVVFALVHGAGWILLSLSGLRYSRPDSQSTAARGSTAGRR